MKKILFALILPGLAWANGDQCVLQDRTVTQQTVTVNERADIRAEVVPAFGNGKKCMVSARFRIGGTWHTGFGEYEWPGDRSREEACGIATKRAEDSVRDRVAKSKVVSEKTLICSDNPDLRTLRQVNPGTVGLLSQFRPHPDYPRAFWHNGTHCRIFLDSVYQAQDIRTFQGVICRLEDSRWVVVDKF